MVTACAFVSCSEKDKEESANHITKDYTVKGKVEKGPFVSGSTINLQPMDAQLQPTGSTFSSTITDHLGTFSFGEKKLDAPFAQLTANGYFFNEVTGELSSGTLSLRAIVNLAEQSTVNVNILTHLKYARILDLVEKDGKSYTEANRQAQKELFTAFGLQRYEDKDAADYSISSGTEEAGALIAISSLIQKGRSEAQMTEYLAKLSKEFGETGAFSVETKETIKKDRNNLISDLKRISKNIIRRYAELNQEVKVVPLEYYFDWNDDGIAGNEIADLNNPPQLSQSEINVPKEGGEYTINITSMVPLYLEYHDLSGDDNVICLPDEPSFWQDIYDRKDVAGTVQRSLEDNVLKITVSSTGSKKSSVTEIPLYDFAGNTVATVTIKQEGDPSLPAPKLGRDAESIVLASFIRMADAMAIMTNQVNYYGNYEGCRLHAPLEPYNSTVGQLWSSYYTAINYMLRLEKADKEKEAAFTAPIDVFKAIAYYNMVTLWGDVPYLTEAPNNLEKVHNISRTSQDQILNTLETEVRAAIDRLEEKKNSYDKNSNDIFFVSKDVARILLADIYMYRGKYDKAEPLLSKVVSNRFYSFGSAESECIMAYGTQTQTRSFAQVFPLFTWSDVILSLAECENNLGNTSQAWQHAREVASYHGTFNTMQEPTSIIEYISKVRELSMSSTVGRFAFLKRTSTANILFDHYNPSFDYMLLFPIPQNDVDYSPNMTQNPGYGRNATRTKKR